MTQTKVGRVFSFREELEIVFHVLKANNSRNRVPMAVVFLRVANPSEGIEETEQQVTNLLEKRLRQSDVAFMLDKPNTWCIFMSQSGEVEAARFLQYLFEDAKKLPNIDTAGIVACVAEIRNGQADFSQLLQRCQEGSDRAIAAGAWEIEFIPSFKEREVEVVKVSIIEPDEVVSQAIRQSLEQLKTESIHLQIRSFKDGFEFLQSDWYASSHFHILFLNDILPRKNGLDVLHSIRKLPNNKKFYIFLMTKSKSEETIIYSLDTGADDYIEKPFNIRLFDAKVRRVLNRLWQ